MVYGSIGLSSTVCGSIGLYGRTSSVEAAICLLITVLFFLSVQIKSNHHYSMCLFWIDLQDNLKVI